MADTTADEIKLEHTGDLNDDSTGEASGSDQSQPKKKRGRISTARGIVAALVFVMVAVGLALHTGTGTLSSFGWDMIATICPLGALESLFGALAFIPRVLIVLAVMVIIILITGRAFCSWACPVPHIHNLFRSKKSKKKDEQDRGVAASYALDNWKEGRSPKQKRIKFDSRYGVLIGALLSSALCGFPVFCLVCPVGLTFGTFILFWRLVQFNEPSWGLLLFPVIIALEVVVFRRWCGTLCPMGALLSLISSAGRAFRPTVDRSQCLRDVKGASCQACDIACTEHIDPYANLGKCNMTECVKCGGCIDACPVNAIHFSLFPKRATEKGLKKLESEQSVVKSDDVDSDT